MEDFCFIKSLKLRPKLRQAPSYEKLARALESEKKQKQLGSRKGILSKSLVEIKIGFLGQQEKTQMGIEIEEFHFS